MIPFSKYSSAGNDFILIDNRNQIFPIDPSFISKLCHRQEGIGADGVLLWEAPFQMRIFNCDGSEAEMCGNGLRAFAKYVQEKGVQKEPLTIGTMHQKSHVASTTKEGRVKVQLAPYCNEKLFMNTSIGMGHFVDTGVPHTVFFVDAVDQLDVEKLGREVRFDPLFQPKGTNVNFVEMSDPHHLRIRTYERGVERETLACGTGAYAASVIAHLLKKAAFPLHLQVRSGATLTFNLTLSPFEATMEGPACKIFEGVISKLWYNSLHEN